MAQTYSDNSLLTHPKPEFEHYRKNTLGVYTDWVDEADVIATITIGRRTQKTFRISGADYICEADGLTFTPKYINNHVITFSLVSDSTYVLNANVTLSGILIKLSTNLTSFKVGTTLNGDEIVSEQDITSTGNWQSFLLLYKSITTTTLYFSGITGTVNVELITL
jgi:hypothetical protein